MLVLGLTGPKLSGKTCASKYLMEKYAAQHSRFSKILEDLLKRLYLPESRDNEIAMAQALRGAFGPAILAHVLKRDIETGEASIAVIDGIRFPEEISIFKTLPNFNLIYINSDLETRYHRAIKRVEKVGENEETFEQFKAKESASTEVNIYKLEEKADFKIENVGTLDEFYAKIEEIVQKLK